MFSQEEVRDTPGPDYKEQDQTVEDDLKAAIKTAALSFGKQEKTILDLTTKLKKSESIEVPENLVKFIKQAFPQLVDENSAYQLIMYLLSTDYTDHNSWYNTVTMHQVKNKLDLIQAIISIGKENK